MYAEIEKVIQAFEATGRKCEYIVFGYRAAGRFHDFLMAEEDMPGEHNIEDSCFMGRKIEVNRNLGPNDIKAA